MKAPEEGALGVHLQEIDSHQLNAAEMFSFTFVRDPLKRFLSLYNYIFPVGHWRDGKDESLCTWGCETIWNAAIGNTAAR